MSSGSGGTNTVTQQSGPPQDFLNAYNKVFGQAQQVAATPNTQYPGQTVAGFSPDQSAGITATENAYGMAAPYINTAAQYINNSTAPLAPGVQPYVDQATGLYNQAAGIYGNVAGGLTPEQIRQYQSPYTQDVVDATQAQFNNQNAIQQNQLAGNAGTAGAFGGDRQGVAQAVLAGQQQTAQAPVIAGLRNQGYQTGLNTAEQQQQLQLGAGQGLGSAGAGLLGASGQLLGANEANAWLNSQAGYGMANLGNAAQTSALTGANALLGVGGLEQQQGQALLNAPYQQYLAQQAYPFQSTGWLANIAEGLGGASGGNSSTTSPGPSVGSQIAGAGLAGAGILGQTGAFGSNGYLTGADGLFAGGGGGSLANAIGTTSSGADAALLAGSPILAARGGMIPHRAPGGALVSDQPLFGDVAPVSSAPSYGMSLPGMDVSVVPGSDAGQMGNISGHHGPNLLKTSTGSTSTTTGGGGGDSTFGSLLKTAGAIAAGIYGGPAGALAANALGSQVHFARGGGMRPVNDNWSGGWSEPKRAAGGATQVTIVPGSYAHSPGVPQVSMAPLDLAPTGSGMIPAAAGPQGNAALSSNPTVQSYLGNTLSGASFAPPPVYTPPPPAPPAPLTGMPALQQAVTDFFGGGNDVGHGSEGGNRDGGRLARRADGGGSDDDYSADRFTLLPPPPPDAVDPITQGLQRQSIDAAMPQLAGMGATRTAQHSGMGPPVPPAGATNGPPPPPLPTGSGMQGPVTAGAPQAQTSSGSSPWSMLTDVGLGIMGGTSPNALTNVGRGALQGLKQASSDRQADAQTAYRQQAQSETGRHNLVDEQTAAVQLSDKAQQALAALKLKDRELGVQEGNAAETARYHDIQAQQSGATLDETKRAHDLQAQQRQDQINLGKYTYQNDTRPDPDDPTKRISGITKLDMKNGTAEFIRTDTDPNKGDGAGGMSGRESVFFNRVAGAGNQAALALKNISELPMDTTSTGWLGGREQGHGLLGALKESVTNKLTPQGVQTYNTMLTGVSRNLASIEASGMAPGAHFTDSMGSVTMKEGDTPLTQMHKMAEMRQIVEMGLEPNLSNPRIPQQQRDLITRIIKNVQESVPFTQHDVTMFERNGRVGAKGQPGQTLADFASGNNLGAAGQKQSSAQPAAGAWKYSATGAQGFKAFSNDGKAWFKQDGSPIAGGP